MKSSLKIVMVGAPGSGKGTQASRMTKELNIPHISTGEIFREYIANKHPLGNKIKEFIDQGALVPDDVVLEIVSDRIGREDCKRGFIFDGFPRTLEQANALEQVSQIDYVINLDVPEERLMDRLTGRRTCKSCKHISHVSIIGDSMICPDCGGELTIRADDVPETVRKRLEVYESQTKPIIDFYKQRGKLIDVNSDQAPDKVFSDILEALGEKC